MLDDDAIQLIVFQPAQELLEGGNAVLQVGKARGIANDSGNGFARDWTPLLTVAIFFSVGVRVTPVFRVATASAMGPGRRRISPHHVQNLRLIFRRLLESSFRPD